MQQRDLIIFFGLFVLVAWAQEASQNTNSTDINHDPRRIPTNNRRVARHNWPPHHGVRAHSPDVFQRMRMQHPPGDRPRQHEPQPQQQQPQQQEEILAVTEMPAAVTAETQKKQEMSTNDHQQNVAPVPSKIKGGEFEKKQEQMLPHRENPWMHMHSGPSMRPSHDHFNNAPSESIQFSSGSGPMATTNENTPQTLTVSQPESSIEKHPKVFPSLLNPPRLHFPIFEAPNEAKLTQRQLPSWDAPHAAESGKVEDFRPFTRDHFFNFNRFGNRNRAAPVMNNRDESVMRVANRPPDIIIRNTFQDRPKSFIDLRISIDDNGVLNVEAGPQGIVRNSNSSNSTVNAASNADDMKGNDDLDLEEHWARNRPMNNLHHVSGLWAQGEHDFDRDQHHGPMMRDKRIPFWVLRGHNSHPPRFGHGPVPMQVGEASQLTVESQPKKSQLQVFGPSHPPVIPAADEMQGSREQREEQQQQQQVQRTSKLSQETQQTDPIEEPMVKEMIQQAAISTNMSPNSPNSAHANDQKEQEEEIQKSPEPEVNSVINIDDFSSSGCPAINCPQSCPGGLTKLDQQSGCPTCDCCPNISCRQTCANGYDSDQFGCPICRCV